MRIKKAIIVGTLELKLKNVPKIEAMKADLYHPLITFLTKKGDTKWNL
jgi:hypothetical protein